MKLYETERSKPLERTFTVDQVAEMLGIHRVSVYRLLRKDPTFPAFRAGKRLRFRETALNKWMAKQEEKERAA